MSKHIGLRLGVAFAVLIAILMSIGQLGLRRTRQINEALTDITGRRLAKLQLAKEALKVSNRNSRITMEIFLLQDKTLIDPLLATRSENTERISELMAEIESRCESEKEKQLLSAVEATRKPYIDSYLRALHLLVGEKKHDAAEAVMVNETLPALLKYHAAWDEFGEFQKNQVEMAARQANADYSSARHLASLLIALAVAVALTIALFVTRETVQRTRELADANTQLASEAEERRRTTQELRDREDRLRLILESTAEAIYGVDLESHCTFCNPACLRLLGYEHSDELLGKNMRDLIHHSRPGGTKLTAEECDVFQAFPNEQGVHVADEVLWKADGTPFPAEYWSYPQRKGKDVVGAVVAFVDITERKVAEKALRESEQRFQSAFEYAGVGMALVDLGGNWLQVNSALCDFLGYTSSELLATNVQTVTHPDDLPETLLAVQRLRAGAFKIHQTEKRYLHKDGHAVWGLLTASSVTSPDGKPSYFVT